LKERVLNLSRDFTGDTTPGPRKSKTSKNTEDFNPVISRISTRFMGTEDEEKSTKLLSKFKKEIEINDYSSKDKPTVERRHIRS
jgi:hypothetical protein